MKRVSDWPIRVLLSLAISIGTYVVIAEVIYFVLAISSPSANGYLIPIEYIPGFYLVQFMLFANDSVLSIVSFAIWFTGSTAYLFLRLSEKSKGLEYKFLKHKYIVLVSLLFALMNLALGMFYAVILILIFLPVFMYLPLPRIKPISEQPTVSE